MGEYCLGGGAQSSGPWRTVSFAPHLYRARITAPGAHTAFVSRPDHGAWSTHRICIAPGSRRLQTVAPDTRLIVPSHGPQALSTTHSSTSCLSTHRICTAPGSRRLHSPHLYRAWITAPENIRSRHGSSSKVTALRPSRPRTRAFRVSLPGPCTSRSSLVLLLLVAQAPTEQQRLAQGRARPQKCSVGTRARVALSPAQRI